MLAHIYKHDDEMDLGRTEDKAKKVYFKSDGKDGSGKGNLI